MFREFEPESWKDWALIPWWLLRWLFAWLWTQTWGYWRVYKGVPAPWAWMWGRHESPEPTLCRRCFWAGPHRWTFHTYYPDGLDDIEPVDECPRCGAVI